VAGLPEDRQPSAAPRPHVLVDVGGGRAVVVVVVVVVPRRSVATEAPRHSAGEQPRRGDSGEDDDHGQEVVQGRRVGVLASAEAQANHCAPGDQALSQQSCTLPLLLHAEQRVRACCLYILPNCAGPLEE
jgi:hypothetical protein